MPIRIVATSPTRKRQGRRGQFGGAKKYVPDVAKSAQHPHSKLKTQKELKKITDSAEYKKGDYKKQTEMLGGKTWTAQEMQTKIKNRPKPKKIKIESNMESRSKNWPFAKGGRTGKTLTKTFKMPKRKFPKNLRKRLIDTLAGGVKGKPHSSPEGQAASAGRTIKRIAESRAEKSAPLRKDTHRIGLQHGSRPRPSGPHTWVRSGGAVLKGKKVGIQIK